MRQVVADEVAAYQERSIAGLESEPLADPARLVADLVEVVAGLGVLGAVLDHPGTEDVFVEGSRVAYFAAGRLLAAPPAPEADLLHAIRRLLSTADGAVLDQTHPIVDGVAVLGGRARLNVSIPPASDRLSATIRLYTRRSARLSDLVATDTLSPACAALLETVVQVQGSVIVCGATGSGKTSLLAGLLRAAHPTHNIRLVEETFELDFTPHHGGRLQIVPGAPHCSSLRDLLRVSLRQRPDIVVVGEVRGAEAWDLAQAATVGAGFLATLHARSASQALERLVTLSLMAGENIEAHLVRQAFAPAIDLVVHCERDDPWGLREGEPYRHQVTEVRALVPTLTADAFSSESIFVRDRLGGAMRWTGSALPEPLTERLERRVGDVTRMLEGVQ